MQPLPAEISIVERTDRVWPAFRDRTDAGRVLGGALALEIDPDAFVLALPRGGIPVAVPVALALGCEIRSVGVRKLPIPTSPAMGFGAVTVDGTVTLNHAVMRDFGVSVGQAALITEEARREATRRAATYPGASELPPVEGRRVVLIDDGLTTGYTVIATAEMVRHHDPSSIEVAVPVAPESAIEAVSHHCDRILCLIASATADFSVASFYAQFPELTDDEIVAALLRARSSLA